jgi:hypothetical protein
MTTNSSSAKAFCDFIKRGNDESKDLTKTKIAFLMGAGFSKSWNPKSPLSSTLFEFSYEFIEQHAVYTKHLLQDEYALQEVLEDDQKKIYEKFEEINEIDNEEEKLKKIDEYFNFATKIEARAVPKNLQDIVYSLSMQLKYPAIRNRYMDDNGIVMALNELKVLTQLKFERLVYGESKHLDQQSTHGAELKVDAKEGSDQKSILEFFKHLKELPQIHFDFVTTNYDCFIESIMAELNNNKEEFEKKTYRGISPLKISNNQLSKQEIVVDEVMDTIIKINGGFEIQNIDETSYRIEYSSQKIDDLKQNPPVLIMPSNEQDYTDHYFSSVFPKAVRLLQDSEAIVIVGYSFPKEDTLVRFIIRQFAESSYDLREKTIFYIGSPLRGADKGKKENDMKDQLKSCFSNRIYKKLQDNERIHLGFGFVEWVKEVANKLNEKEEMRKEETED